MNRTISQIGGILTLLLTSLSIGITLFFALALFLNLNPNKSLQATLFFLSFLPFILCPFLFLLANLSINQPFIKNLILNLFLFSAMVTLLFNFLSLIKTLTFINSNNAQDLKGFIATEVFGIIFGASHLMIFTFDLNIINFLITNCSPIVRKLINLN